MNIDEKEFDDAYNYLMEKPIPWENFPDTVDTDVISGTEIILGAAWRLKNGIPPEKNEIVSMEKFLSSMQMILKSSDKLKDHNERFQYCQQFTKMLTKVYQCLVEYQVKIKPFPTSLTPKEELGRFLAVIKESQNILQKKGTGEQVLGKILPIPFNGIIHIAVRNQTIPIKVMIDNKEKYRYVAQTDIYFKDDKGEIACSLLSTKPTLHEALEEISKSIVNAFEEFPNNSMQCYYDFNDFL